MLVIPTLHVIYIFQETNRERETEPSRGGSGLDQRKEELGTCPHQPNTRFIETQSLKKKTLKFQDSWFRQYKWIHYSPSLKVCFVFTVPNILEIRNPLKPVRLMELLLKPDSVTGKKLSKGSLNMKTAIAIQQR